jgi:excisionase family DNA binding protein
MSGQSAKIAHGVNEAAEIVGVGRDGIYDAIKQGKLIARKYGKRTIITFVDLQAFVDSLPRMRGADAA